MSDKESIDEMQRAAQQRMRARLEREVLLANSRIKKLTPTERQEVRDGLRKAELDSITAGLRVAMAVISSVGEGYLAAAERTAAALVRFADMTAKHQERRTDVEHRE